MGAFASVLVLLLLRSELVEPLSTLLTPPPGNSLAITAITLDGTLKYGCEKDGGQWLLLRKRATMVDQTNHTKVLGFYTKNYHQSLSSRHMGTWTMINSEGDEAESGHPTSLVSGNKLVSTRGRQNEELEFLAQAGLHRNEGAARRVSYIAELNTKLKASPPMSKCEGKKSTSIGYEAEYAFWIQDVLPPKVPNSLMVPSHHRVVEAFFAQGNVRFIYNHTDQSWREHRMRAKLYDVPGGVPLGGFSYNISLSKFAHKQSSRDLACIVIANPNGFKVCGTQSMTDSSSDYHRQASLPWSLFRVTSNNGNITNILGPFSFFHMVSTWGGLPPQTSNKMSAHGATPNGWKSYFTAIIWLYTNKGA